MSIRKILVPMPGAAAGPALDAALRIGASWGAHVSCVHVHPDGRGSVSMAGEGLAGSLIGESLAASETETDRRNCDIRDVFRKSAAEHGLAVSVGSGGPAPTASLEFLSGREDEVIPQKARLSDLTVMAYPDDPGEGAASSYETLHAVLFDSGRPVLLAPTACHGTFGKRICIAWNGTAESAASVASALPWMARAEAVLILSAEGYQRRGPEASELAAYLRMHGIEAGTETFSSVNGSVGAGLLSASARFGCDLLSMGAYSHSRLRQFILGGVTRHVLEAGRIPVMMSR